MAKRGDNMCEEEMKLHSFVVSVEYEVTCYTEDEALSFYAEGQGNIVDVCDMGAIE